MQVIGDFRVVEWSTGKLELSDLTNGQAVNILLSCAKPEGPGED